MSKGAGNGGGDLVQKSPIPGAIVTAQDEQHFLLEHAFTQSQRFVFAADEVKWFLIDPTNYTPDTSQIFNNIIFRVPSVSAAAGPIFIDFYSGPTLGAAVATALALPPFNRVAVSAKSAQLELSSLNIAPTSLGSPISQLIVPSTATGVGQQTGFSIVESLPFSMNLATTLLMVLTNNDGNDTDVGIRHGWFEI